MATLKYADLLPYILPDMKGCSDMLAEQAIAEVVMDFCTRTAIWRVFLDAQIVIPGRYEYDIDVPADATLVQIRSITIDGLPPLTPKHDDFIAGAYPLWKTERATPKHYFQTADDIVNLAPCPAERSTTGMIMQIALKPSPAARTFPEWIYTKYMTGLHAGIKAKLMLKPGHQFTNAAHGSRLQAEFDNCIATAMNAAQQSLVRSALRTTTRH